VYDKNEDGVITKEEIYDVFSNSLETERLFDALDSKTGNIFVILKAVSYKNSSIMSWWSVSLD
jgi:Ca2+-binding EF-hand superfamily protein